MTTIFLNEPDNCQWLRDTALRGVSGIRPFRSFVLYGNEDAPDRLDLYAAEQPNYIGDAYQRVDFTEGAPVYCTIADVRYVPVERGAE